MTLELKTRKTVIFHLNYSEKACQDHATLVIFKDSVKAGSHDPIFGSDFYSNSKKLLTRTSISISWNNARKKSDPKIRSYEPALKGKSGQKVNKAQMKEYEKCKTASHHWPQCAKWFSRYSILKSGIWARWTSPFCRFLASFSLKYDVTDAILQDKEKMKVQYLRSLLFNLFGILQGVRTKPTNFTWFRAKTKTIIWPGLSSDWKNLRKLWGQKRATRRWFYQG